MTGKIAFIAGAGSIAEGWGNGRSAATLLARQGAKVFGVDISKEALDGTAKAIEAEGLGEAWAGAICDMTNASQVSEAINQCVTHYGQIDVLVNVVGGSEPGDPVALSEESWDSQIEFNLKTAYLSCKYVLPVMERQFENNGRGGSIVNLSSIAHMSSEVGGRVHVAYAASKAGVVAFGRATAIAWAKKGVRINTVVVGKMHTPLVEARLMKQLGDHDGKLIEKRNASIPMGRMGSGWDVANAVLFLASDEAGYITGTQIVVDGGVTAAR